MHTLSTVDYNLLHSYVNHVTPGSPAANAGLMASSILLDMNGVDVRTANVADIVRLMSKAGATRLTLHVELNVISALVAGDVLKKVRGDQTYSRVFRLASDCSSLLWESKHRPASECFILSPFISTIRFVQSLFPIVTAVSGVYFCSLRTERSTTSFRESYARGKPAFQKILGGDDETKSFSIVLWQNGVVLDLVAQSAHHCRAWVTGLNVRYVHIYLSDSPSITDEYNCFK